MKKFTESQKIESSWLEKDSLVKEFKFKSFKDALDFINLISIESEKINHHPDIKWTYDKIEISLKTHDKDKITELDYKLSKKIDKIYSDQYLEATLGAKSKQSEIDNLADELNDSWWNKNKDSFVK